MDEVRRVETIHRIWAPLNWLITLPPAFVWAWFSGNPIFLWAGPTLSMAAFYLLAGGRGISNPANLVSLVRVVMAGAVFFLQGVLLDRWILLVIILAAAELLDWLDGRLAVRIGPTRFGELFDEEADAYFVLTVSALLIRTDIFGPWVIVFGVSRYLFSALFELLPDRDEFPRGFSRFARTVCGITAGVLIAGFGEILLPTVRIAAAAGALGLLGLSFVWETILRFRLLLPLLGSGGLLRSYAVYYLVPGKSFRMRSLYDEFLRDGDIAFDIGAHLGNRIRVWREMGVRVIAVEPNPECLAFLSGLYGSDDGVVIVPAASGAESGRGRLYVDPRNPTLATVSSRWIREVEKSAQFSGICWDRDHPVDLVTLDELVHTYGTPRFIKIDTEGFDHRVLEGLSTPVRGLSFEYLPASLRIADEALRRVEALGSYEFNLSPRETMRFHWKDWRSPREVRDFFGKLSETDTAGDIYARSRGPL